MRAKTEYSDPSMIPDERADGAAVLLGRELELTGIADIIEARFKETRVTFNSAVIAICGDFDIIIKADVKFVRDELRKRGIVIRGY